MRGLSWFGTANVFRDGGWRDASPSRLGQVFGKLGWHDGATQVWLSASGASSDLYGNGLQDGPLLASRYASVYTRPDRTRNDAGGDGSAARSTELPVRGPLRPRKVEAWRW